MISPLTHLVFILMTWLLCFAVRLKWCEKILAAWGFLFLCMFAPIAAGWITLTCIQAWLLVLLLRGKPREGNWRKYGAYLLLLNLLFVDVHPLAFGFNVETLAISFSTIRIFMTAKQLLSARKQPPASDCQWIFIAAFYLPALLVGPVFSGLDIKKQSDPEKRDAPTLQDHRLVLQGLVLAILANPAMGYVVSHITAVEQWNLPHFAAAPFLFLQLFTAFWGQSLIAEHTSRYFGIKLPVNFDMPWRATNIRDFWQRWHRSMAQFVMQYIYLPLNLRGISPRIATVAAFTFMGVWHNLSIGYLIWGVSHGLLLAFWPKQELTGVKQQIGVLVTWLSVISLSYIANFGPLA